MMIRVVLLLFIINPISFSVFAENISTNHPSPYVRMHANDAVKWQVWDKSVLDRAKKENKLIFISSGYFACHWCHVMRKESFTDEVVASYLNNNFIPVKIDRELNPVLDKQLIEFIKLTQGVAGWPLNVFITPDGYPLTGFVYLPKDKFISVIKALNLKWRNERSSLEEIALKVFEYIQQSSLNSKEISAEKLRNILMLSVNSVSDELEGGFGNTAKFPMPYLMMSLLDIYEKDKDEALGEFIELTLSQMLNQGLHDSIGGGFFRYTIDQGWQVPHFEKMLHTNAAMIKLYVNAYKVFGNKKWLFVAEETLDFVINEMKRDEGGYVSSLNAQDESGEEGGNYVWEMSSIKALLSAKQSDWFDKNIKLSEIGEEGKFLPLGFWWGAEADAIKKVLIKKRIINPPVKDNKMIVSWNAYLLSAMIDLKSVTKKNKYKNAAIELYNEIQRQVEAGLIRNRQSHPQKYLQDYVFVSYALWKWHGEQKANNGLLLKLISDTLDLFYTESGWSETDRSLIPVTAGIKNIKDGDLPSAEAVFNVMIESSSLLRELVNKKIKKQTIFPATDQRVIDNPLEYSRYIMSRR